MKLKTVISTIIVLQGFIFLLYVALFNNLLLGIDKALKVPYKANMERLNTNKGN